MTKIHFPYFSRRNQNFRKNERDIHSIASKLFTEKTDEYFCYQKLGFPV